MVTIKAKNVISLIKEKCPVKFEREVKIITLLSESNSALGTIRFEFNMFPNPKDEEEVKATWWVEVLELETVLTIKFPFTDVLEIKI